MLLCSALLGACARDRIHVLRVSVPDQQMAVYARGVHRVATHVPRGPIWGRMSDHLPLLVEFAWDAP